jgi:hypothetical protein
MRMRLGWVLAALVLTAVMATPRAVAANLCVNPSGTNGCSATIQGAVALAKAGDVIYVAPGVYREAVTIGVPLALIGSGQARTTIDASGLGHGVFVDGYDHPGLAGVTISGFTIEHALYEGVLVVSAADVIVRDNRILGNDSVPGAVFTPGAHTGCPGQPGSGIYETDETGDCGGAVHLVGAVGAIVSGNLITGNADGILVSDETGESRANLLANNVVMDNPLECGIVLASHPPSGKTAPPFGPHFGVDGNTVIGNLSQNNGVQVGGSGVGLFSDGAGPGKVSGNVVVDNRLIHNGLGGVALHTHVGPAFGLPADDMCGNQIIGNYIAGNLADQADTATPGPVGININSGGGGSPVMGTVIARNTIRDEAVDVAVNTPALVGVHLNNLLGGQTGVADVCALDGATMCAGAIAAAQNYWGCPAGPGASGCSTASGSDVTYAPWLLRPATPPGRPDQDQSGRR